MGWNLRLTMAVLALAGTVAVPRLQGGEAGPGRAPERLALLQKVLDEVAARVSVADQPAKFQQEAVRLFSERDGCRAAPAGAALSPAAADAKLRQDLQAEARRLHPDLDKAALVRAADAAFPQVFPGDTVTVTYQYNPARRVTLSGTFHGLRGDAVLVGGQRILLRDLRPPPSGEACSTRFDAAQTKARRAAYVTSRLAARTEAQAAYVSREFPRRLEAARQAATAANEKDGYLWQGNGWKSLRVLVAEMIPAGTARWRDVWLQAHPAPPPAAAPVAAPAPQAPDGAGTPAGRGEAAAGTPAPAVPAPTATAVAPSAPSPTATAAVPPPVPAAVSAAKATPRYWVLLLIPVVLVAGGWLAVAQVHGLRRRGFWHGNRDAAEKGFWEPVRRHDWPYVAYVFPDHDSAHRAMERLSFIDTLQTGDMLSLENVHFGIYQRDHHWVAFVGGPGMHFSLWRECVAVFGRGNGAVSDQVSEAPGMNLELPDPDHLSGPAAQVYFDRDYDGEGDDYRHYVLFKGPGEAASRAFLRRLAPPQPGIYLVVETPHGQWGRDADGYYKE